MGYWLLLLSSLVLSTLTTCAIMSYLLDTWVDLFNFNTTDARSYISLLHGSSLASPLILLFFFHNANYKAGYLLPVAKVLEHLGYQVLYCDISNLADKLSCCSSHAVQPNTVRSTVSSSSLLCEQHGLGAFSIL